MRTFAVLLILLICTGGVVRAQTTTIDFEDLVEGTYYYYGDTFTSSGIHISCLKFYWSNGNSTTGGQAAVWTSGYAGGSGKDLWICNVNVSFGFAPLSGLSLLYGEYGGNLNIEINGDFRNFHDFPDINGLTIGGVHVSATQNPWPGGCRGVLALTGGTINSFAVGGQELAIDNVTATPVPEPSSLLALLCSLGGLVWLKRNRE